MVLSYILLITRLEQGNITGVKTHVHELVNNQNLWQTRKHSIVHEENKDIVLVTCSGKRHLETH